MTAVRLVVALLTVVASGCTYGWHLRIHPRCADGRPVQLLTDPRCPPDSICGYSCLPDRWATTEAR